MTRLITITLRALIFCCTALSFAVGQESPLTITKEADSLMAGLLRSPQNTALERQLVNEYIRTLNPELALVEVSYAEKLNLLGDAALELKGRIQASLEHIQPALANLKQAYLQSPSDEALLTIGILEYARGNKTVGGNVVRRIKRRSAGLSVDLLNQYEKFYLNGRKTMARAISGILRDVDSASFNTFFPSPKVTILSPVGTLSTEASQASVIFEVRHTRPIQRVGLQGQTVYDRGVGKVSNVTEEVNRSFTQMVTLSEGTNLIPIAVMDIFGIETVEPLTINRMSFERRASWHSPLQDSLEAGLLALRSYVPDRVLMAEKKAGYRTLVMAGGPGTDATEFLNRGLFFHQLLTHRYTGFVPEANAKLLLADRVTAPNFSLITQEWLLKGATFQSTTVLYLCGNWRVSSDQWAISDVSGVPLDVKPALEQLTRLATAAILIVCDGRIDSRQALEDGLTRLADASSVPVSAVVLGERTTWPLSLIEMLTVPSTATAGVGNVSLLDAAQISGSRVVGRRTEVAPVGQSPARKIAAEYAQLLVQLNSKLSSERVSAPTKASVVEFCRDWRRYSEVVRYINNQLSLADLSARADEYRSRKQ